jgi:hypothetical protein
MAMSNTKENASSIHLKPANARQIANFTGTLNSVGSTLTRIDEDGKECLFAYDATYKTYVYQCDDGMIQHVEANRFGEWVWRCEQKDLRRAYEIYNPIFDRAPKRNGEPLAQVAEAQSSEAPCRLAAVMASNGDATNYHYCANGKLVGVITVSGNPNPLAF